MMCASRRVRRRRSDRRGFSIPELLAAVVILAIGVLGLAGSSAVMSRQMTAGAQQTVASQVAESRFESLRGQACAGLVSGNADTRGVREAWVITPAANKTVRAEVTVSFTAGQSQKVRVYTSGLTC